ncbi:Putative enoyl-CoA hydratase echA8 OS=Lysinibacillus sphaericus OX=1421 GN=echA8 PE=3 SV=1 [Lysinibacillus sphaericus]
MTTHRPQAKNALTANMWDELAKIALKVLDNPKNKVLILRKSR